MFLVSIIIPCYNVESYIKRAMNSLVKQTIGIDKMQIILVDDASTDNTLYYLKEMESSYPEQVYVIPLESNMGQGKARNIGLLYAEAPYIAYLDADDWIEPDMYEKMLYAAEKTKAEVIMCKYDRPKDETAKIERKKKGQDNYFLLDSVEKRNIFLAYYRFDVMCWNKVIRKDFIEKIELYFPEKIKYEDNFWGIWLYLNVETVFVIEECLYHWYINPKSTVRNGIENLSNRLEIQLQLLNKCRETGFIREYKDMIEYNFYDKMFVETIFYLFQYKMVDIKLIQQIKELLLKEVEEIFHNPYYTKEKPIEHIKYDFMIRKLLEQEITLELINQVKMELIEQIK